MKKLKKLCFLLSLILIFLASGCGGGPQNDNKTEIRLGRPDRIGAALSEPAEVIDVAEYTGSTTGNVENNAWGVLAARSFQGLINRTKPRLYIERVGQDKWGVLTKPLKLDAIKTIGKREINYLERDKNSQHYGYHVFWTIFYKYHEEINRLWVFDEYDEMDNLYPVMNLAVMLAGRDGSVAVSRPLADQIKAAGYDFEEVDVLTYGGFTARDNPITLNDWAIENLLPGSNPNMVFALWPVMRTWYQQAMPTEWNQFSTAYDMAVAFNAFIYQPIPYTERGLEQEKKILSNYSDGIPVIGWAGEHENQWITHLSDNGKIAVAIDWEYNNGSLWAAFPPFNNEEGVTAPLPPAEEVVTYNDTVYIAFSYSDGDAFHYSERDLVAHLSNPVIMDTDIPMGWTIPSIWRNYNPVLLEYVYNLRRPGLCNFIQGPSAISYIYASRLPEAAYERILQDTKTVFGQLGINMVNFWDITPGPTNSMVGADEKALRRYIEVIKPDAVFLGQSSHTGDYRIIDDVVVIEEVGNFKGSGNQTASQIVDAVDRMVERQKTGANAIRPDGPVFVMLNINAWGDPITMVPDAVNTLKARLGAKYEFVTPAGLVAAISNYEAGGSLNVPNPKFK